MAGMKQMEKDGGEKYYKALANARWKTCVTDSDGKKWESFSDDDKKAIKELFITAKNQSAVASREPQLGLDGDNSLEFESEDA